MTTRSTSASPPFTTVVRDGTSQADRIQAALAPDYVAVDEHSNQDLLQFLQRFAQQLHYVGLDNSPNGTWQAFFGDDFDPEEALRFIDDPTSLSEEQASRYQRPHFVLLLTFLKLLEHTRTQMNGLTERHLQFYYHDVLGLSAKPARAASVHVLLRLRSDLTHYPLTKGTRFAAGEDTQGHARFYQSTDTLMLSQAQVASIHSCYIDWQTTTLRNALYPYKGALKEGILVLLALALGEPDSGDALPNDDGKMVDFAHLQTFYALLRFIRPTQAQGNGLYLEYSDFRSLIALKTRCEQDDAKDWARIDKLLIKAGKKRTADNHFQLNTALASSNPHDFNGQFFTALGITSATAQARFFDGITDVESFDEVYTQRHRSTVKTFIKQKLSLSISDFSRLMQLKIGLAARWTSLLALLTQSGQRQRQQSAFSVNIDDTFYSPSAFQNSVKQALPALDFSIIAPITHFADLHRALQRLEDYFFLSAEEIDVCLSHFMQVTEDNQHSTSISDHGWKTVYALLEKAHQQKVYTQRQHVLRQLHHDPAVASHRFSALLAFVLGADDPYHRRYDLSEQLETMQQYLTPHSDEITQLQQFAQLNINKLTQWEKAHQTQAQALYAMLERAQRRREHYRVPAIAKRQWRNLYPLQDATQASTQQANSEWYTFGQAQAGLLEDTNAPASLGWAISSPLLNLRQGKREIRLRLFLQTPVSSVKPLQEHLQQRQQQQLSPFRLLLSTDKGWHEADFTLTLEAEKNTAKNKEPHPTVIQLVFTLLLDEQVAALTQPTVTEEAENVIPANAPLLKIVLRQHWQADTVPSAAAAQQQTSSGYYTSDYQPFKSLYLQQVALSVNVQGLIPQAVQNDEETLDPHKPFYPFGLTPSVGSRLYLGDPELAQAPLDRLQLRLTWMDLPTQGLQAHYQNYPAYNNKPLSATQFHSQMQLVDKGLTVTIHPNAPLFAKKASEPPYSPYLLTVNETKKTISEQLTHSTPSYHYRPQTDYVYHDEIRQSSRYWQWELTSPDFQHSQYPRLASQTALALSMALSAGKTDIKAENYQINPPYTPKLKGLQVDYQASITLKLSSKTEQSSACLYHLHPFGYTSCQRDSVSEQYAWLPQYNDEGYLYIGLRDVTTPQRLSLLFQLAEGTADPALTAEPIAWHYLSDNQWLALEKGRDVIDHTNGFSQSGRVLVDLPTVKPSTLFNNQTQTNHYYLRASIASNSRSVCQTLAIHTQAVLADLVVSDSIDQTSETSAIISQTLASNTIQALATSQREISVVEQPYPAFGGKTAEASTDFYTRVSERLRHKQRTINAWDYEHVVLEQFPSLYKVKCLANHHAHRQTSSQRRKRGAVHLVVIPDIRHRLPFDPFAPKVPARLLQQIQAYVQNHSSPFAQIKVQNAHYVAVKVRCSVRFRDTLYSDFYRQQLNDALNRFLSPWAYDNSADIVIGGEIYANSMINFIEQQPYVDYVAGIKLFRADDEQQQDFQWVVPKEDGQGYRVSAAQADSVLVAARNHTIDIISEIDYEPSTFNGIGYMKVGLDFVVA